MPRPPHPDLADVVRDRRTQLGLSQSEIARRSGVRPQTIQHLESGKIAQPRFFVRLARALGMTPTALAEACGMDLDSVAPEPDERESAGGPVHPLWQRDVPVLGTASGGLAGSFVIIRETVDLAPRPPGLAGVRDAYAIYVVGRSMAPVHKPGDLRYVHPHRPCRPGDTVVLRTRERDGVEHHWIKELVKVTEKTVTVRQLNPAATVDWRASNVLAIHKVLSVNEMVGVG